MVRSIYFFIEKQNNLTNKITYSSKIVCQNILVFKIFEQIILMFSIVEKSILHRERKK
jgi:hypothetical protein